MNKIEQIRQGLRNISKPESFQVYLAEVTSVNEGEASCNVKLAENDLELFNVRIKSIINNDTKGMMIVPVVGSKVLVGLINDNISSLYVVNYSEIEKVQYHDGSFGGFVKADILKQELDKTNEVVQALVDSLTNWTPGPTDSGAALKTYFATQIANKQVGSFDSIENDKLIHGQ